MTRLFRFFTMALSSGLGLLVFNQIANAKQLTFEIRDMDSLQHSLLLSCWGMALVLFLIWKRIKPNHVPKSVPGPPRTPGVGCLPYILERWLTWPDHVLVLSEQYNCTWGGPVPNFGGLGGALFYLVDEKCVRHILQEAFDTYEKGESFRSCLSDFLGNGIFAADGDTWRLHRKLASHYFSRNLLRESSQFTKAKLTEIINLLNERAQDKANNVVDMQDIFFQMTIDVISNIAFGVELDSIGRQSQHPFTKAFDEAQALCHDRFVDPTFRIKRFFQLTPAERKITACLKTMQDFTNKMIQEKRRTSEEGGKLGPDLISRYFDAAKRNNEDAPTNKELHDVIMNFVIAGRDTTACALSWAFYELSKKPEVVEKIVKEVNQVCGTGDDANYSYENMNKLPYTHAVVVEVLRLHPSVPADCKYAIKDDVLPDGTFIPKGSMVNYYPYYFGRSKHIWGPNAADFQPERFLNAKEPSPCLLPVFNAGYRLCLGKPLAIMNMKLTMAHLLPRLEFADVNDHSGEYVWTLVMSMKGGFPVQVKRRV